MPTGNVVLAVVDNGGSAVTVPSSSVQVKIGPSTNGVVNQIVATRSLKTLSDTFGSGPLMEAAGLAVLKGITCICVRIPTVTPGAVRGASVKTITAASDANPLVVTAVGHGFQTGDVVTIAGVGGNVLANGTHEITKLTADTFSIPVDASLGSAYTSGGTATFAGVVAALAGTSAPTISGTPVDDFYVQIDIVTGGTIGTAGIVFTVSLDAGRVKGPQLNLGAANSYVIPGTGLTVNFSAGTLVAGDQIRFSTTGPKGDTAGVVAALNAIAASQYAVIGWGGGTHIIGPWASADAQTFQSTLETLALGHIYTRAIIDARDAAPPTAWGGTGETEAAWMTAIETDFGSADAKRVCCAAGCWNMPTAFANQAAGLPRYRRPVGWALAVRQGTIPPQRHAGRVRDGGLEQIVVDAANDPNDGFVYHDERNNPGLDNFLGGAGRFATTVTRPGKPGVYISNPLTLAAVGSDYQLLPRGMVMDLACDIVQQTEVNNINDDVRVNLGKGPTDPIYGTIFETDARVIERTAAGALRDQMVATAMISGMTVHIDRTTNILTTSKIKNTIQITGRGFILEEDVFIGYANANAAS
jgi:Protein of unknown function (DUF2586)/Ubiquitin-activating enzyme E1 FCCH domain